MYYGGINAKIKTMKGKLFKSSDYNSLCNIKTVVELGNLLKEHSVYSHVMADVDEKDMHRGMIEQKLGLSIHEDYSRIYKFISDFNVRKFLDRFFLHNEIDTIKFLLCMIYDERDITYTLPELNELLGSKLKTDLAKLKNSKTVPQFIEGLENTEFKSVLNNIYNEDTPLFQLEMQLDLYYYNELWKAKNKYLNKENEVLVEKLIGSEIDVRNITWIYRLKKFYELQPNVIYTYLIPINYRLKKEQILRMAEAKTVEEVIAEIKATVYGEIDFKLSIEHTVNIELGKIYTMAEILHTESLAVTLSYLFFKQTEVKNIISLMEGIRYGLPPGEIMKFITLLKEEEAS